MENQDTKKSLFVISHIQQNIEAALIESGGEITSEIEGMLTVVETELPAKIDDYKMALDVFGMKADYCREKAAKWSQVARSMESVQARLKSNIETAMKAMNVTEIVGNEDRVQLQNSPPACEIMDVTKVPNEYKEVIQYVQMDKKRILEDLKLGFPVPGCELVQSTHVRFYPAVSAKAKAPKAKKEKAAQVSA